MQQSMVKVYLPAASGSTVSIQMMSVTEAKALLSELAGSTNVLLAPIYKGLKEELEKVEPKTYEVTEVFTHTVKADSYDDAIKKVKAGEGECQDFVDYDAEIAPWEDMF